MTDARESPLAWLDALAATEPALSEELQVRTRLHHAAAGLRAGDLVPFAALLKAGDPVPSSLRLLLVLMIEAGPVESGGLRIKVDKHPDIARRSDALFDQARKHRRELEIAAYMARQGALQRGGHEGAVVLTAEKFGLKRSRIQEIWRDHKQTIKQMASRRETRA